MLSAIEDTQKAQEKTETSALGDLTHEEDSLFQPEGSQATRPLPPSSKKSLFHKSAAHDTTQHLWELSAQLHAGQQQQQQHHRRKSSNVDMPPPPPEMAAAAAGQSDMLAFHAAKLVSRRKHLQEQQAAAAAEQQATSGASKWGKLRATVQVNAAMKPNDDNNNNFPITPSAVPQEVTAGGSGPDDDDNNDDVEQGSSSNHKKKTDSEVRKSKKELKKTEGLNAEFQAFRYVGEIIIYLYFESGWLFVGGCRD